jgi:hypothetical protein
MAVLVVDTHRSTQHHETRHIVDGIRDRFALVDPYDVQLVSGAGDGAGHGARPLVGHVLEDDPRHGGAHCVATGCA